MRATRFLLASIVLVLTPGLGANQNAWAQRHELPSPPPTVGLPGGGEDVNIRLFELRDACRGGDRNACVRFGIILGEHRERLAEWRRDHPDLFFYEEEERHR
jgi:hypothetical protein